MSLVLVELSLRCLECDQLSSLDLRRQMGAGDGHVSLQHRAREGSFRVGEIITGKKKESPT